MTWLLIRCVKEFNNFFKDFATFTAQPKLNPIPQNLNVYEGTELDDIVDVNFIFSVCFAS